LFIIHSTACHSERSDVFKPHSGFLLVAKNQKQGINAVGVACEKFESKNKMDDLCFQDLSIELPNVEECDPSTGSG
jgi:hypothetical protein